MSIGKTTNPIATKYAGKSRQKSPETDVILGDGIRKSLRPIVREKKHSKMEMGRLRIYLSLRNGELRISINDTLH